MSLAPVALIFVLFIILFVLLVWLIPVRLWVAAWSSGAHVGFGELIGMRLRRVSPGAVVNPRIAAVLVDCLKICERYDTTGQEPSVETCCEMVREMRDAAVACTKRPPRGIRS